MKKKQVPDYVFYSLVFFTIFIFVGLIIIFSSPRLTFSYVGLSFFDEYNVTIYRCGFNINTTIANQTIEVWETLNLNIDFEVDPSNTSNYSYNFVDNTNLFDIDPVTGQISYTAFSGDVGSYIIALGVNGTCSPDDIFFRLDVTAAPAEPTPTGGAVTEYVYIPPPARGGCHTDADCPQDFRCTAEGFCTSREPVQEIPVELGDLPDLEEPTVIPIVSPEGLEELINSDLIPYPSFGLLEAIRSKLIISRGFIDLSLYNTYYSSVETPLSVWLSDKPLLRNMIVLLVSSLVVLFVIFLVLKTQFEKNGSAGYSE